jgi:hypothetical protein
VQGPRGGRKFDLCANGSRRRSFRSPSAAARPVSRCCGRGGSGGNPGAWWWRCGDPGAASGRGSPALWPLSAAASPGARRRWRDCVGEGGGRRHSSLRRPGRCRALQRHGSGGAGRGIGVPTAANGGASPQHTAPPLPSHHRPPSPPRLPTLLWDPPPAAGVQDGLRLQRWLISAQCCGRWRTLCARWPLELQSGRRYYQQKAIEACLHNVYA